MQALRTLAFGAVASLCALTAIAQTPTPQEGTPTQSDSASQSEPASSGNAAQQQGPGDATQAPTTPAAATSPDAASSEVPAAPEEDPTDGLTALEYKRITKGFTRAKRGDETMYCRMEMPHGSRLPKKTCWTLQQLVEQERIRAETRPHLERKQILRKQDVG